MNVGLYNAAAAIGAADRWQEMIAGNLAASAVPGYRKQEMSFSAVQAGQLPQPSGADPALPQNYALPRGASATSFLPGELRYTGNVTDVAIDGSGFFEVQLPSGGTAYTRDGEFQVSSQGQLVTKQGYAVMGEGGPIQIDRESGAPISISADGEVTQGVDVKGRLKLTEFADPRRLTTLNGGMFLDQDPAAGARPAADSGVRQRWLEGSNTTVAGEMANLLVAMRTFEANQRVIQMQDDRISKTINALETN